MANAFYWYRAGNGEYAVGLGQTRCVTVTCPDDALAAQWAQTCCAALNARERMLNEFGIDVVYNTGGTVNEARSEAQRLARDKWEANAN